MLTECSPDFFGFEPVEGRAVVAAFDAGAITSDAGALLLGATDRAIDLVDRFAGCFCDRRRADLIEHTVASLVRLTPNTEPDHNPLLDMTAEDLGAEILADFRNLFPEYDLAQLRRLARREAAKSLIFRGRTSKGLHYIGDVESTATAVIFGGG